MIVEGRGYEHDGVAVMARGDVVMAVFRAAARLERSRWLFERIDELVRKLQSFMVLLIVLPTSDPPDRATRVENTARVKAYGERMRRVVTTAVGDSFRQSVVRAIMRALAVISGTSKTQLVVATIDEGIRELMKAKAPETPDAAQIRRDVDELLRLVESPARTAEQKQA
jgi:hypothetical protein